MKNVMGERERQACERVRKLLFLRLAAVLSCLAVIVISHGRGGAFDAELTPAYLLLTVVGVVNLVYLVSADRVRSARRFACFQICLDMVFATLLIYLTGAGASNITFVFFGCILAASIILGLRPGVLTASLATVVLAAMKTLTFLAEHYGGTLPWSHSPAGDVALTGISASVAFLLAQAISYHLVAVLAGQLAHGLRGVRLLNEKILESISDGLVAVDNQHHVRLINREAIRLLGLPPGLPMVGRPADELAGFSKNAVVLRELFSGEQPGTGQVSLTTLDGRNAPAAVTASMLRDDRGTPVGLLVMFIDLTERKRLEAAMARAETMEMMGQLAASIAHEIRNPLACIRGSAQEVRSDLHDEQCSRLLDMVVREADRINTIVTDFLHFSRMRSTALKRCNVTDALADVVTMLESRRRDAAVDITLDVPEPLFCLGDVEQLRQVFLNLGLNALDAMPEGGRLCIVARPHDPSDADASFDASPGPRVTVEFIDDGRGMSDEVRSRLFNPFFTTKPRGTGLGLSIVRRIVEAHKGRIEVESIEGRGSTFRVVLEGCPVPELQVSHV
ncbi:MAG TPA: ATP-binding protein [Planctomycetota bacterium]|nr:ATP-binding protein [Planctomycetota bacterium]